MWLVSNLDSLVILIMGDAKKNSYYTGTCTFLCTKYNNYQGVSISKQLFTKINASTYLLNGPFPFIYYMEGNVLFKRTINSLVLVKRGLEIDTL